VKILLAKCPRAYASHFEENSESLALGYLTAALRAAGRDVDILDASLTRKSLQDVIECISKNQYDFIGFTITDSTFLESTFDCINTLRERGVQAHLAIGGYTPSFQYAETLQACPAIDSVTRFEGEQTVVDLIDCIERGSDWRSVAGIAYLQDGSVKTTNPRSPPRNLDVLPFPARDCLSHLIENLPETGAISVSGSRGCYANCSFCSIRAFYDAEKTSPIRFRSVTNIVDEIEELVAKYHWQEILLVDDVFVIPNKMGMQRIQDFINEFERRNLRVMLSISERVCNVTDEIFGQLRRMGVRQVLVGVEAGSDDLLDYYNKKTTSVQNRKAIETLARLEIDPTVSFINFAPVTTLEQLRHNLRFLLSLRVNFLQGLLNRFQIYAGTPLGDEMLRDGRVVGKFPKYDFVADDPRADVAYKISRQSLGLFLATAFEMKRIARKLRRCCFEAESNGDLNAMRKARNQFLDLQQSIMWDAADVFEAVLDFSGSQTEADDGEVQEYIEKNRAKVRKIFRLWCGKLAFFEQFNGLLYDRAGQRYEMLVDLDVVDQRDTELCLAT
jgi:anaerobic magnesium-protoporphyrin IX monomethyl ester cyclase